MIALRTRATFLVGAMILVAAALCAPTRAAAGPAGLRAAAHGDHLWFVREARPPLTGFELCHHAADVPGESLGVAGANPVYRRQAVLAAVPDAMSAWNNRVWLVFESRDPGTSIISKREVYSLEVTLQPSLGVYINETGGRLDLEPMLPPDGALASFIATHDGPFALLVPNENAAASAKLPALLQLVNSNWKAIPLPQQLAGIKSLKLASTGIDRPQPALLAADPANPARTLRFDLEPAGHWTAHDAIPFDLAAAISAINVNGQLAVASASETDLRIAYLRPTQVIDLALINMPTGQYQLVPLSHALQLVEKTGADFTLRAIDPITGEAARPVTLTPQTLPAKKVWQFAIMLGLAIGAVLLLFVMKPRAAPLALPKQLATLPLMSRAMALAIDIIPGTVITMLALRCSLAEVFQLPFVSADFEIGLPYITMAALTIIHQAGGELMKSTTLGKALVSARVANAVGERPKPAAILIRSAVKAVVFLIPPLALFALFNATGQGLPDLAAGTVVVREVELERIDGEPKN